MRGTGMERDGGYRKLETKKINYIKDGVERKWYAKNDEKYRA